MQESTHIIWSWADISLVALLAFICTCVLVIALTPIAISLGLVDRPDLRKQHAGSIPLVGGLAVAGAVSLVLIWTEAIQSQTIAVLMWVGLALAFVGSLDDYYDISPRFRLLVQIAVGLVLFFAADLRIVSVGELVWGGHVTFGVFFSLLFTVMCSVGVFNSINMIDGIDGLAGSMFLLSALAMASISALAGDTYSTGLMVAPIAATLAFLLFNLGLFGSRRKVFLGDSGSLFLGSLLLWFFIYLSQGEGAPMSPVVAGWVFGVPLADTVSVIVGRLLRREHPLVAGRDHIHHRLLSFGFSSKQVLIILVVYHVALVSVGVMSNGEAQTEPWLFVGFVLLTISHFFVLSVALPRFYLTEKKEA